MSDFMPLMLLVRIHTKSLLWSFDLLFVDKSTTHKGTVYVQKLSILCPHFDYVQMR